jgi:hypothetical protein
MLAWRVNLTLLAAALIAMAAQGVSVAAGPKAPPRINLHVDSVVASDTHEGVDARLAGMGLRLRSLFNYSTYRLISHQDGHTECGKLVSFMLPGGRILHIQPRAVDGDMIVMELVLFQGPRPLMTTDLKLKNHGVLIVGGPRYEQGMLIISIGADAVPNSSGRKKPTASASAN